jgi:hypothetical protein
VAIIIYGGGRQTVDKQLRCEHQWHGPCMDEVSRYNKCLKCFCLERDFHSEAQYFESEREREKAEEEARKEAEAEEIKLCFGDLRVGDNFIGFPEPGDNHGHGGYLEGSNLFLKTENLSTGKLVPHNSGAAVNGRGVQSYFPRTMAVYKIHVK